jgi:hypothetical protein
MKRRSSWVADVENFGVGAVLLPGSYDDALVVERLAAALNGSLSY